MIKFTLQGDWPEWNKLFREYDLRPAAKKGIRKASLFALAEIDKRIRAGKYEKLASITLLTRKQEGAGRTPLLRNGGLIRAIEMDIMDDFSSAIGITQGKIGDVALTLHEGTTIKITPAMKRAFVRRFGNKLRGRATGKSTIRIPPRKFIADVFDDPGFQRKVEAIFFEAFKASVGI